MIYAKLINTDFFLAHWVWAGKTFADGTFQGGLLRQLGAIDFAGGTVVHMSSGYAALVAAFICGPRRKVNLRTPPEGHNIPMFMIGVVFLWFGWFGFNGGSALNASGIAGLAFTNSQIATGTLPELHFTSTHHLHPLFACLPYTILRYHSQTTLQYSTLHYTNSIHAAYMVEHRYSNDCMGSVGLCDQGRYHNGKITFTFLPL